MEKFDPKKLKTSERVSQDMIDALVDAHRRLAELRDARQAQEDRLWNEIMKEAEEMSAFLRETEIKEPIVDDLTSPKSLT